MPIYTYKCEECTWEDEYYVKLVDYPHCKRCNSWKLIKIPSVPGYRRDHTVVDDE